MRALDPVNRQRALQELGVGPLWQLRQSEPVSAVAIPGELAAPNTEPVVIANAAINLPETEGRAAENMPVTEVAADHGTSLLPDRVLAAAETSLVPGIASTPAPVSAMSWDELQVTAEACVNCGLCRGRKKVVFGTGDRQAKWLFVGEGPGYNENLQGLPFVGAAGQLLDNMLKSLKVQRGDQAYIANIVKCRPTDGQGKDRPPTADEIAACLPYLHRQIALMQPQVIVALGKTAAVSLLGLDLETPIGQLRGKLHQFKGIPMVATYHPAYLLRKPAEKSKAWVDLCLARQAMPTN